MRKPEKKMLKYIILFISVFTTQVSLAQVTFVITNLPQNTVMNSDLYISGDFEGWTGGQEKYKLTKNNKTYFITLPENNKSIQYKFTQGSWKTVETDKNGKNLENRHYDFIVKNDTVKITINSWSKPSKKSSTASKNVHLISDNFDIPQLHRKRRIWVYVPPDYDTSNNYYPVIYMHDGQNLFDDATSFSGEWEVDETLDNLFIKNKFKAIVIGIDNGADKRLDEYSPWINAKYGGGQGENYIKFIVQTLKPYIDKNYRTYSDRNNTAIFGSSMGGLISFYAALKFPDIFGKAGVFSPSFWFAKQSFSFAQVNGNIQETKMYFLAGNKEGEQVAFDEINETVKDLNHMTALLKKTGYPTKNMHIKIVSDGKHNEKLWKENFEEALLWLFDKH